MRKKGWLLFIAFILVISSWTVTPVFAQSGEVKKITILHTNDSHGRVEETSTEGMGFAKIASLLRQFEQENENTLLFDAGDTLHGKPIASLTRGESIVEIMNKIGYDAMAAGNHDFNYGYERLLELEKKTVFPVLSANVRDENGELILQPYEIREVDGIKLGIFGLTTPETHYKTHPKNVEGLTFTDPVVEAKKMVETLKEADVDMIIAITHLGIDESSTETSIKVAKEAPGIDLIVDGHSHSTLVKGLEEGEDTLIVSAGEYTKNLGVVELTFEDNKLVSKEARLITKAEAENVVPDEEVEKVINRILEEQEAILSEAIGKTNVVLDGEREQVRTGETNLGNLVTDAMIHETGADVAITNGGGIRSSVQIGDITIGDVVNVFPFGNFVITKELTGAQIKEALENGVKSYPDSDGAFSHVAGITFKIDASKPAGERVHSMVIGGNPVNLQTKYVVATNDFIASGGDEYTVFGDLPILNEYPALDEVLKSYISEVGEINIGVEGRITEGKEEKPSNPSQKVYWDGIELKQGQIGRITVQKKINLWKRDANQNLQFVRVLNPGEVYRVYGYDQLYFGQYAVGAQHYVTNMSGYIKYETPSKSKLAEVNR